MNVVIICSDQHNKRVTGCYGNPVVRTPNLDKLASGGALFENAYTSCPMCMPARASMVTGRYPFEGAWWDNAHPYNGEMKSFAAVLENHGVEVTTIGKLHFKDDSDKTGFLHQILPMHAANNGIGEPAQCLRNHDKVKPQQKKGIENAGPGFSKYIEYDQIIADKAVVWLEDKAKNNSKDRPWLLYVGFVNPHPPHIAPDEEYSLYEGVEMPMPQQYGLNERPMHPVLQNIRRFNDLEGEFDKQTLSKMIRTYYAKVTFLDSMVGHVVDALERTGLKEETLVIYLSDHGECLGAHGLWFKQTMYEESCGIPLIISGPDIPKGIKEKEIVCITDLYATALDCFGISNDVEQSVSWLHVLKEKNKSSKRSVFSEFHCCGAYEDIYMIRKCSYKYIYITIIYLHNYLIWTKIRLNCMI